MDEITIGDIVWAKMMGFPHWPCVVLKGGTDMPKPSKDPNKKYFWVYFFGSNNYAWIPKHRIGLFEENKVKYSQPQRNPLFTEAVKEAETHLGRKKANPNYKVVVKEKLRIKEYDNKLKEKKHIMKQKKNFKRSTVQLAKSRSLQDNVGSKGVLDTVNILTSKLVFGVLGTGIIGSGIIKNLIRSGHVVNIWNRTMSKCDCLIDELGTKFKKKVTSFFSPRAMLQSSNIIFVCVSNQEVVETIFHNSFGINNAFDAILQNKGIIQMTTTGPETSKDLKAVVEKKGGKYLEAQIQGSKMEAIEGNLLILAAGDKDLFFECQSCFKAIGKTAMYLGDVGYASKLNLILQLIKGVQLAALAEGMALAERCGVPHKVFMDIFSTCQLNSSYLSGKANAIVEKDFNNVEQALRHFQRDLKLGLDLSNNEKQPMFLASAANELFKHCKRLEYGGHDAAVIYMRNKH